jgi:hypothetical protein
LLIAQTKVINGTFLKLFAVKAQPYLKKILDEREKSHNYVGKMDIYFKEKHLVI